MTDCDRSHEYSKKLRRHTGRYTFPSCIQRLILHGSWFSITPSGKSGWIENLCFATILLKPWGRAQWVSWLIQPKNATRYWPPNASPGLVGGCGWLTGWPRPTILKVRPGCRRPSATIETHVPDVQSPGWSGPLGRTVAASRRTRGNRTGPAVTFCVLPYEVGAT